MPGAPAGLESTLTEPGAVHDVKEHPNAGLQETVTPASRISSTAALEDSEATPAQSPVRTRVGKPRRTASRAVALTQ